MSNGSDEGTGASCGGTSVVNGVVAGSEWQCVELVNRLYLSKGWISSTWHGNGGRSSPSATDSMYDEAPASFAKQPNGSISYIGPGDVISINIYDGGAFVPDGHVLVANTSGNVTGGSVSLVSENSGDPSDASPVITGTLSGGTLTIPGGGGWSYSVIGVVHAPTNTTGPPPDGSFVSYQGNVYRIAGGAPLYLSNWAAVGGAQPTQALTAGQWNALNAVPTNGTLISSTATGMVYEIAGGAPLYVSNFEAIGGARPVVAVDQWDLDNISNPAAHMNAVPANGTLIGASAGGQFGGMVFVIAGGAPLYVSSWAAIGGPQPVVGVDEWDIANISNPAAHLNAVPTNGTLVSSTATGMVYEIAGGAPLYVSNFNAIGGARPVVSVDQWDLDNISNPAAHMNAVPANGTLIGASAGGLFGGEVFVIAGGAPLYVSSWAAIGGPQPVVGVDEWDIANISNPAAHLDPVPANGTFIETSAGQAYRIAGGAPFAVSSWTVFGGVQPHVTIDPWDIANIASPSAHLRTVPLDETIVQGLPSGTFWTFSSGYRSPTGASGGAVGVDDVGLAGFPEATDGPAAPGSVPGGTTAGSISPGTANSTGLGVGSRPLCVVPRLVGMTLTQARRALQRAGCRLGIVHKPLHPARGKVLRVTSQSVHRQTRHKRGYPVGLVLR